MKLAVVLVFVIGLCIAAWLARADPCSNQFLAQYPSPDHASKLVVFGRDCGGTTDFSTQASLLKSKDELGPGQGNLFRADTNHGAAPSGPGGGPELCAIWTGPSTLTLAHHARARVFRAKKKVGSIAVQYIGPSTSVPLGTQPREPDCNLDR